VAVVNSRTVTKCEVFKKNNKILECGNTLSNNIMLFDYMLLTYNILLDNTFSCFQLNNTLSNNMS
jgi:hypothetical protein